MSERLKEFETEMKRIKGKKNKQKGIAINKDGESFVHNDRQKKNLSEE